jgi:hypothetical protein
MLPSYRDDIGLVVCPAPPHCTKIIILEHRIKSVCAPTTAGDHVVGGEYLLIGGDVNEAAEHV